MTDAIKAWQCIGCGRIEAPEPCIGVCRDRRIELVDANDYQRLKTEAERLRQLARRLEAVVRQMALSTPHDGEWERSFKTLKAKARAILADETDRTGYQAEL